MFNFYKAVLVLTLSCCLWESAVSDDYNWYYDGDVQSVYGCWVPGWPQLYAGGCHFDYEEVGNDHGCCVHTESGLNGIKLTCAMEGNECPFGGRYVRGDHEDYWPSYWPSYGGDGDDRTFNGTTIRIDKHDDSTSWSTTAIVLVSVIAGAIFLVGGVVCCCKCTTCCRKRDDDNVSLISQDDIFDRRSSPVQTSKPAVDTTPRWLLMDARLVQHMTPSDHGLPSYEQLQQEDRKNGAPPV